MNFRLLLVLTVVAVVDSKYFSISDNGHSGECVVTTYTPGGSKVTIDKISAPVATVENDVMERLLGPIKNEIKSMSNETKKTSKLLPALGAFAGGVMAAALPPAMDVILDAVNKAISKLTDEINTRLDDMKGYVDEKTMKLERDLIGREYKQVFQMFVLCANERNDRAQRRCMRNADRYQSSAYIKFATIEMPKGKILDVLSVKKLEINLLTFRDYAIARILAQRTLIDTYKDVLTEEGQAYFKQYCEQIKIDIAKFTDYVNKAYFQIKIGHKRQNVCQKTVVCDALKSVNEGLFSVHTADRTTCRCRLDEFMAKCDQKFTIRADGKHTYTGYDLKTNKGNREAAAEVTSKVLADVEKTYLRDMGRFIQKYWTANILNLLPKWKAIEDATYFVKQKIVEEVDPREEQITDLEKDMKDLQGRYTKLFGGKLTKIISK